MNHCEIDGKWRNEEFWEINSHDITSGTIGEHSGINCDMPLENSSECSFLFVRWGAKMLSEFSGERMEESKQK